MVNDETGYITRTITIPNGVKVIEVHADCTWYDSEENNVFVYVGTNNKTWISNGELNSIMRTEYIGVTPNKQYIVNMKASAEFGDSYTNHFYIKYSPEINNKTPTIYDY